MAAMPRRLPARFVCALCGLMLLAAGSAPSYGQSPAPSAGPFIRPGVRLALPPPSEARTADGAPGPGYWQQRADYHIAARLDPRRHTVEGTVRIRYTNHSPDALDTLWLQLDQNLFASGSRGAQLQPEGTRWSGMFAGGGFRIASVSVEVGGRRAAASPFIDDTRMRLALPAPVAPHGGAATVEVGYAFTIPEYGADRMGRLKTTQGTVYEVAQWYPRMFVYDDVTGWDTLPYLGQGEFYLEYGDYEVALTVPRDYLVVATGELQNPEEVYTPEQRSRLEAARRSAETVGIVRPAEVGARASRPRGSGELTWRYKAANVRDFAWAASDAFILDAAGWKEVLILSAYPREALGDPRGGQPGWEASTQYARHAIAYYSGYLLEYPYPVAINVAGIVGGMEYPMIVFCSADARGRDLFGVTDHEFGHSWFPMIVGSNERRHAWMDEGFNTFINHYSLRAFYGPESSGYGSSPAYTALMMRDFAGGPPIAIAPDSMGLGDLGFLAYRKPGNALVLLREAVLGPEAFDEAFRTYTRRWAYKHPTPADFFRTFEDVTGRNLDWFWLGWLYSTKLVDQGIASVAPTAAGAAVTLRSDEPLLLPVELEINYADGRTATRAYPVEDWGADGRMHIAIDDGPVIGLRLDPALKLPDVDVLDNLWRAEAPAEGGGGRSAQP